MKSPILKAHLFICTKCTYENPDGSICAEDTANKLRNRVKEMAKEKWDKKDVRINASGCLGQCSYGIASCLYPQEKWFIGIRPGDESELISQIEEKLGQ